MDILGKDISVYIITSISLLASFNTVHVNAQSSDIKIREFEMIKEKAEELISKNTDSAAMYAEQLITIAATLQSEEYSAKAYITLSLVKLYQSKTEEALALNQKSFIINKKLNNSKELAKNYYRFGIIAERKSDYITATDNFLQSLPIAEKEKLHYLVSKNYRKLSILNVIQEKYDKALEYGLKAVENQKNIPTDEIEKAENLANLATCYKYLKKNDFAEKFFSQALAIYTKENYQLKKADVLCEMAAIYNEADPLKSIATSLKAQVIFDKIDPEIITSINNMGNLAESIFTLVKNDTLIKKINFPELPSNKDSLLDKAEFYLKKSIQFSQEQEIAQGYLFYSGLLSDIQAYRGNYEGAFFNLQKKVTYNDSLFSQENKNAIAKLEAEKDILKLQVANKQKAALNKILLGSAAALLLISLLAYRNFRSKQKLQQATITELEKDKQLLAIDAMLKGQEEERSRIAKDLHDGLGGMLSGTKLSFMNMKENLVLTPENATLFDKSLSMLDNTIGDLRKVAHNLMPEALVKYGLVEALRDFCDSVQSSTNLKIVYQPFGENRKLSNTAEVFIYRIIQELVNNAVKHAEAKQIIVQLTTNNNKIGITVEDDGKGFDPEAITSSKGDGLANIKYRVQYLNGTIDRVSSPGNGTSVNIEVIP